MSDTQAARIAIFLSGGGRTLEYLAEAIDRGKLSASIVLVVASRNCAGVDKARARGLQVVVEEGVIASDRSAALLREADAQWVVLAGYLKLLPIPPGFEGRVVNIHPSLLPKFGGPGMFGNRVHQAVLDAGESESGCTVHVCDDRYDTGPVLAQLRCPVYAGDTSDALGARVFALEQKAYPAALQTLFLGGNVSE